MLTSSLMVALAVLPTQVDLKTPEVTFTASVDLALHEGKLWWRARGTTSWALFAPDGLPHPTSRKERQVEPPARLTGLSADGDNVVVWGADGRVFYAKLSTREWTGLWGPPTARGPLSVDGLDAVAMSHRKVPYEDVDGNPHPVTAGVTTFYALADGGRQLRFADPWLPPRFEHTICLPEHGHFVAAGLSASASTLFVMDASGRAFTRLYDFDTSGDDPALPYSWAREHRTGARSVIRSLPPEDWRPQPRIDGWQTTRITITQTGPRNADRELRVEGRQGYWHKALEATEWTFVETGTAAEGTAVQPGVVAPPSSEPVDLVGRGWPKLEVRLRDFDPNCAPARLVFSAKGEQLEARLDFHGGLDPRRTKLVGAVRWPAGQSPLLDELRTLSKGQEFLEVRLELTSDEILLTPRPGLVVHFPRH